MQHIVLKLTNFNTLKKALFIRTMLVLSMFTGIYNVFWYRS